MSTFAIIYDRAYNSIGFDSNCPQSPLNPNTNPHQSPCGNGRGAEQDAAGAGAGVLFIFDDHGAVHQNVTKAGRERVRLYECGAFDVPLIHRVINHGSTALLEQIQDGFELCLEFGFPASLTMELVAWTPGVHFGSGIFAESEVRSC